MNGLNDAIVDKGRQYIGTALTIRDDPAERKIIDNHTDIGSVTPENAMKWDATEPNSGISLSLAQMLLLITQPRTANSFAATPSSGIASFPHG